MFWPGTALGFRLGPFLVLVLVLDISRFPPSFRTAD